MLSNILCDCTVTHRIEIDLACPVHNRVKTRYGSIYNSKMTTAASVPPGESDPRHTIRRRTDQRGLTDLLGLPHRRSPRETENQSDHAVEACLQRTRKLGPRNTDTRKQGENHQCALLCAHRALRSVHGGVRMTHNDYSKPINFFGDPGNSLLQDITLSGTARGVGMLLATYNEPVTLDTINRLRFPGQTVSTIQAALNELAAGGYLLRDGDRYQLNPDVPGFPGATAVTE